MKFKDELQKYQSESVKVILVAEEKGQRVRKTGKVHSCENNHVVFIDGMGKRQYIAYANMVHLEQASDGVDWSN